MFKKRDELRERKLLEATKMASCLPSLSVSPCLKWRVATLYNRDSREDPGGKR